MTRRDEDPDDDAGKATQRGNIRPGGKAKGGIEAQPGDPTSPKEAAVRAAASNREMKARGFGDHQGEDFGSDGSGSP